MTHRVLGLILLCSTYLVNATEPPAVDDSQVFRGVGEYGEASFSDTAETETMTEAQPLAIDVYRPNSREARQATDRALEQALMASELAEARAVRNNAALLRERDHTAAENRRLRLENQRLIDERQYAAPRYVVGQRFHRFDSHHGGWRHSKPKDRDRDVEVRGGPPPLFASGDGNNDPLFQPRAPRPPEQPTQRSSSTVN